MRGLLGLAQTLFWVRYKSFSLSQNRASGRSSWTQVSFSRAADVTARG